MKTVNKCLKCDAVIFWRVNEKTGKSDMVNADGTAHLCAGTPPQAAAPQVQPVTGPAGVASTPSPVYQTAAPIIDADAVQQALPRTPTIAECNPPAPQGNEQVVIHRHEGQESRPDSITFADSTKIPGVKIYLDLTKPDEVTDIIDHAFVAYSYALSKMVQMKEDKPQLFNLGVKA